MILAVWVLAGVAGKKSMPIVLKRPALTTAHEVGIHLDTPSGSVGGVLGRGNVAQSGSRIPHPHVEHGGEKAASAAGVVYTSAYETRSNSGGSGEVLVVKEMDGDPRSISLVEAVAQSQAVSVDERMFSQDLPVPFSSRVASGSHDSHSLHTHTIRIGGRTRGGNNNANSAANNKNRKNNGSREHTGMAPGFVSEIQTRHRPSNTNSEQASSASTNENKLDLKSRFGTSSTENGDDSSSVSWEDFAEESFDSMVVPDVKIAAELEILSGDGPVLYYSLSGASSAQTSPKDVIPVVAEHSGEVDYHKEVMESSPDFVHVHEYVDPYYVKVVEYKDEL